MRKVLFLIFLLVILSVVVRSFHIVGGEIEFITIQPGTYQINLIQYKDEAQTQNTSYDPQVTVYIYSNQQYPGTDIYDSIPRQILTLPLQNVVEVEYTNFECAIDELQTSRILYSAEVNLDPEEFADPEGYYLVWERCCRNGAIDNIVNPVGTGMKYVLEIPPLWRNNRPYVNSSPVLNRPLSDYACVNQLYYISFTGTDLDGDSLVYKMATPLNSSSQIANPPIMPKPHIPITWEEGFSLENVIHGSRELRISNKGLLTVNPSEGGLYVFSVIVEEYRNGLKIGEVQRDFQMLVVSDGCDPPDPPRAAVQIPGNEFFDNELDTLSYEVDDEKCFEFVVVNIEGGENISFRAEPVNFIDDNGVIDEIFAFNQAPVGVNQDTLIVEVCAPSCPPARDRPLVIDLIAADDACPLPQLDTVRLVLEIEPPPNADPEVSAASVHIVDENRIYRVPFQGTDLDPDELESAIRIAGVEDPSQFGFSLEITREEEGYIEGDLVWDTNCNNSNFQNNSRFFVDLSVNDLDFCNLENAAVQRLDMRVILPPNTFPDLTTTASPIIQANINEPIDFTVNVNDDDGDAVDLRMISDGFSPETLGVSFDVNSISGSAEGIFKWNISCDSVNVLVQDSYPFLFVAEDQDKCNINNSDTIEVIVLVNIPENSSPEFEEIDRYVVEVNSEFELDITALDIDEADSVTIRFSENFRRPSSNSLSFPAVSGRAEATSTFTWTPECDLLDLGQTSRLFQFIIEAQDDRCPIRATSTTDLFIEVRETREFYDRFEPSNAFSPNGDGKNDFFSMSDLPRPELNLPPDNCDDQFLYISIHNRNGTDVFYSESRDFIWDGQNVGAGTYYYVVKYTRTEYNGYIQLLR